MGFLLPALPIALAIVFVCARSPTWFAKLAAVGVLIVSLAIPYFSDGLWAAMLSILLQVALCLAMLLYVRFKECVR